MNERIEYKSLNNDLEIEKELENILNSEDIYDEKAISLYNVLKLAQKILQNYEITKEKYNDYFEMLLKKKYDYPRVEIQDNLYGTKELTLGFIPNYKEYHPFKIITFAEDERGIYLKQDETDYGKDIYRILNRDIVKCYLDLLSYSKFLSVSKRGIKPLNSNLFVTIDKFGVVLSDKENLWLQDFSFAAYSGFGITKKGQCDCNNKMSRAYGMILDNERKLLEKIFVEIEDCPEWSKEALYEMRNKELNSIKTKILKMFK